jgi:hypothetical protein
MTIAELADLIVRAHDQQFDEVPVVCPREQSLANSRKKAFNVEMLGRCRVIGSQGYAPDGRLNYIVLADVERLRYLLGVMITCEYEPEIEVHKPKVTL